MSPALKANGAKVTRLAAGQQVALDDRTEVEVLWPPAGRNDLSANESSLVLRISCDGVSVLLPGDVETTGQGALAAAGGIAAVVGMGLAVRLALPPLGVVGLSMIGAACHNVAQVGAVAALYTGPGPAARLLPAAFLLAAGAGLATGFVALFALGRLAVPRQGGPRGVPYEWKGSRL